MSKKCFSLTKATTSHSLRYRTTPRKPNKVLLLSERAKSTKGRGDKKRPGLGFQSSICYVVIANGRDDGGGRRRGPTAYVQMAAFMLSDRVSDLAGNNDDFAPGVISSVQN